jgi:hypothetical protein
VAAVTKENVSPVISKLGTLLIVIDVALATAVTRELNPFTNII